MKILLEMLSAAIGALVGVVAGVLITSVISMLLLLTPTAMILLAMTLGAAGAVLGAAGAHNLLEKIL